jgi:DNA polymerase-3 subunit delta'
MGFESLLGNDRLKENLTASAARGRMSHFYLICGPEGSGKHTLAQLLAAAAVCREQDKPCLRCNACRKVLSSNHPDVITVVDPDHKEVAVKLVKQYREDMFIQPNEADKKVYIFPQALRIEGQNALLKILEEPPAYGVCLLLSDNPEALLPTIRSRCTELKLNPLPKGILQRELQLAFPKAQAEDISAAISRSGGYLGQAKKLMESGATVSEQTRIFAQCFGKKDSLGLLQLLAPMEKWKRDALVEELDQWEQLLHGAMLCRAGVQVPMALSRDLSAQRSPEELMGAIRQLKKVKEYAQGNVSPGAICGHLVWALR